jgi:hypothetical protein
MAEEPRRGNSQGYFKEFFLANPTVVLSLLYLYVTAIGMLYSAVLYGRFGINVFDYSEIADFLLAAFKNPVALLSGGLLAVMGAALLSFRAGLVRRNVRQQVWIRQLRDEKEAEVKAEWEARMQEEAGAQKEVGEEKRKRAEEHRRKQYEEAMEKRRNADFQQDMQRYVARERLRIVIFAIIIAVTFVFTSVILPYYSATQTASSIKHGRHPSVDVRYRSFEGAAGQVTVPGLDLIGATEKAAFFYDVDHKRTIVIPQAQIVSIEVPE